MVVLQQGCVLQVNCNWKLTTQHGWGAVVACIAIGALGGGGGGLATLPGCALDHIHWGSSGGRDKKLQQQHSQKYYTHLKWSVCALAVVSLGEYIVGLRPRPNTPDTHQVWKTCVPLCLHHFPFLA